MKVAYLLLAVLLSGCASQTIEPSYYLLRSNEDLQSSELKPVYEGVRNFLFVEIAQAKGEDLLPSRLSSGTTVIDIRIDQMHGTSDGKAQLVAYWWLRRNGEVLSFYRFAESQALNAEGYAALVAAEETLLTQLAKKITASLVVTDS